MDGGQGGKPLQLRDREREKFHYEMECAVARFLDYLDCELPYIVLVMTSILNYVNILEITTIHNYVR